MQTEQTWRNLPAGPELAPLCKCGCGQPTGRYSRHNPKLAKRKGEYADFRSGHHSRVSFPGTREEKLKRFFEARVVRPTTDGCWGWNGYIDKQGYGQGSPLHDEPGLFAHRIAYELFVGPVPDGVVLDHICRNRGCCNPRHLEPVTNKENVLRGVGPSAINARAQVCKYGHQDWGTRKKGKRRVRICLTCRRARDTAYREARREKLA